jgi:hypothetical protein
MRHAAPILAVLAIAAVGAAPGAASAQSSWGWPPHDGPYELEVVVNGSARPVYRAGGASYVEGRLGERYTIRVHNRTGRRVEAVVSVDGRDAIDGGSASFAKRGYVVSPWSHVELEGFRLSQSEVAAFRFTTVRDSYAARTGTPWTVGVIGVAVFPERVYRPPPLPPYAYDEEARRDRASGRSKGAPAPRSAAGGESSRNLGTEFGERRHSAVWHTQFERENGWSPDARLQVRYDDREGLCSAGIQSFCYRRPIPWARPYPTYPYPYPIPEDRRYAQPPPGWTY